MPTNNDNPQPSGLPSGQGSNRVFRYHPLDRFRPPTEAEKEEWKKKEEETMRAAGCVKIPVISQQHGSPLLRSNAPIMQFKD